MAWYLVLSGFTRAGDAKVVPAALVERAKNEKFKVDVYTGASLGPEVDLIWLKLDLLINVHHL